MNKLIFVSLFLWLLPAFAASTPIGGGQEGNGGGGVDQNGRYMTFYSAGFYTEPEPRTTTTVPNLENLIANINDMKFLSDFTKAQIESAILPSPGHSYYAVDASKFDAATQARLLAEFSRVMNVPVNNLALFAVTDTNAKQTFLLPSFFQLSKNDQMAVLFHEAYWLMNPNTTYANVISAEMAYEAVLSQPGDGNRIMDFLQYAGTPSDQFLYALQADKASNALKGFVNAQNQMKVGSLLGSDYLNCIGAGKDGRPKAMPSCQVYLRVQLNQLLQKYPKSLFLAFLLSRVASDNSTNPGLFWMVDVKDGEGTKSLPIDENLEDHYNESVYFAYDSSDVLLTLNPITVAAAKPYVRIEGNIKIPGDEYGDEPGKMYLSAE